MNVARLIVFLQVGKGKIVRVEGIQNQGRTASILLRGSNKLVLEEAERSLHDALCVVRCLVRKQYLIPGGAAPEVELNIQLSRWAKSLVVRFLRMSLTSKSWSLLKQTLQQKSPSHCLIFMWGCTGFKWWNIVSNRSWGKKFSASTIQCVCKAS